MGWSFTLGQNNIWQILLICFVILAHPAGGKAEEAQTDRAPPQADDWFTINKDYSSQRYVDLDQITPKNVAQLKEVWLRWRHVINDDALNQGNFGSSNNRGAAYLDGRLIRGTADGRMIALRAKDGKLLWENLNADQGKQESFVAAPLAWDNKVFTGIATADAGARGRVMGFDAKKGTEQWRFYTVPDECGIPPVYNPPNYCGGAFWTGFSLDPATGELFAPASNPYPDFTGDVRPGDNLYTNALLSLNADGGSLEFGAGLNWYFQAVPHDIHDRDLGTAPTLYRNPDGKNIAAIGGKDGNVYLIDRATHKPIGPPTPGTTQKNGDKPFPANPKFPGFPPTDAVRVCPGGQGGDEFTGTAYSPQLYALYVGMVDWCFFLYNITNPASGLMLGDQSPDYSLGTPPRGWITAIDGKDGHMLWQYHAAAQVQAGPVLPELRTGCWYCSAWPGNRALTSQ
jgi:alcohol dehydrogenase (cytochrome c)